MTQTTEQNQTQKTKPDYKDNWGYLNLKKKQHKYIYSLCMQLDWKQKNERHGEVADTLRLSNWLKSERSPVRKPIMKMTVSEASKIISALESMTEKHHSK